MLIHNDIVIQYTFKQRVVTTQMHQGIQLFLVVDRESYMNMLVVQQFKG